MALLLVFALYGLLLARFGGGFAGGADSSGYLNNARLLREGELKVARREIAGLSTAALPPYTYVPLGFVPEGAHEMVPTYPIGLSLLIRMVALVTGWHYAAVVTLWLHGVVGVALFFFFARRLGLSLGASFGGAALLGLSPLYLYVTLQVMSDIPALVWCLLAVYAAWCSRAHLACSLLAGAAVAMAVLIRPSNALIVLPVALALGFSWRRWLGLFAGGLPGALYLAWFNVSLYGKVATTGYGNVESLFGQENILPTLAVYAGWLPILFTPAVILILVAPLAWRTHLQFFAVLVVWLLSFTTFYAFYFHTHETWWSLRFISPALPPLLFLMLFGGVAVMSRASLRLRQLATAVGIVAVLLWDFSWGKKLQVLEPSEPTGERAYLTAAQFAQTHLPADAVIFAMQVSGAFYYYTDFTLVRWDQFNGETFAKIVGSRRPIYAALFPFEMARAFNANIPGSWTQVGAVQQIVFWRLDSLLPAINPVPPWRHFISFSQFGETAISLQTGRGWFEVEQDESSVWSWSSGQAELDITANDPTDGRAHAEFELRGLTARRVVIQQGEKVLWSGLVEKKLQLVSFDFALNGGKAQLELTSDTPPTTEKVAPFRALSFALFNPQVTLPPPSR